MEEQLKQELWQNYMADAARICTENTAKAVGEAAYLPKRFIEVLNPPKEDKRSGEEIVMDVITRAGLVVK